MRTATVGVLAAGLATAGALQPSGFVGRGVARGQASAAERGTSRPTMVAQPPTREAEVASPVSSSPLSSSGWSPTSWRQKEARQMPKYDDPKLVTEVEGILAKQAPLVFAGECRELMADLSKATRGEAFVLMGGDCAESFSEFKVDDVRDTFRSILQMSLVMTYGGSIPVVKIGRAAGQFAKPRSEDFETIDGVTLPSYRGDIVNGLEFTEVARQNDPYRMLSAYHQSAQASDGLTINLLRAFSSGGFADINSLNAWNMDFVQNTAEGSKYRQMAARIEETLRFMTAIGVDTMSAPFRTTSFYTAHEALLLSYEEALTREDSLTGKYYDCSAHMLWIGERTRQLDGAHIEFLRGVDNPIGIKVSQKCPPEELVEILETVNPANKAGRVTLITRMSSKYLDEHLPKLILAVQKAGLNVLWVSDPVHGNTIKTESGYKTRRMEDIRSELRTFFDVHQRMGTHAGGVHIEMTGKDVTECTGGDVDEVTETDLKNRYLTQCDPRLNGKQSLELAFHIANRLRRDQGLLPMLET
ncbi:unnamed protein product [Pylaiella littoralis]